MRCKTANALLVKLGHPELFVHKTEGVYYLLGEKPGIISHVERCLHVVRTEDLTEKVIRWKLAELMPPPDYYAVASSIPGKFDLRQERFRANRDAGQPHPHDLMAVGFGAAELRATIAKFGWDADLTALPPAGGA